MTCFHPVWLEKLNMSVPCRKCIACRVALTREWTTRLMHESLTSEHNCFLTLTFADEHLPLCRSLCKRKLQLFIKRLRKRIEPVRIKYYAVGEYGENHSREHYHLIIFGWEPDIKDLYLASYKKGKVYYGSRTIHAIWPFGFNVVGQVTRVSCQYVVGYVRKKLSGSLGKRIYLGRLPPFALQSTGLGSRYAWSHKDDIQEHLCCREGNHNLGLPRYYKRLLDIDSARLIDARKTRDFNTALPYYEDDMTHDEYVKLQASVMHQKEVDMLAQERIKK